MGIDIAGLERQEAISFFMWVQSLNKTGFPKNGDGTMKDIWQLYDYWDSMDGMDKKAFWTHARTKEPQAAAALLSGEDWISVQEYLPPLDEAIEGVETKEVDVKFSDGTEGSAWLNGINGWCAWGMNKNNLPVTHWKLPEPPKP